MGKMIVVTVEALSVSLLLLLSGMGTAIPLTIRYGYVDIGKG